MWASGKPATPAEYFDGSYLGNESGWKELSEGDRERASMALSLIGDPKDQSVLDLGGGALLGRFMDTAREYVMVDYSEAGCKLCKEFAPWAKTHQQDIVRFLELNSVRYDCGVAMGCFEYMAPGALETVFEKLLAGAFVLYTPIVQGYVNHGPRSVIYAKDDVFHFAAKHGWKLARQVPQREHVFARFEKVA